MESTFQGQIASVTSTILRKVSDSEANKQRIEAFYFSVSLFINTLVEQEPPEDLDPEFVVAQVRVFDLLLSDKELDL